MFSLFIADGLTLFGEILDYLRKTYKYTCSCSAKVIMYYIYICIYI